MRANNTAEGTRSGYKKRRPMVALRPSKKSRWDFSAETSALRARFVGVADKTHTCADRSVFCLGRAEAKNGFQKPASRANLIFRQTEGRPMVALACVDLIVDSPGKEHCAPRHCSGDSLSFLGFAFPNRCRACPTQPELPGMPRLCSGDSVSLLWFASPYCQPRLRG